jgi:hypothetical protein
MAGQAKQFESGANTSPYKVSYYREDQLWVAQCDALGLYTESATLEGLKARASLIAPELAELNGLGIEQLTLNFQERNSPD